MLYSAIRKAGLAFAYAGVLLLSLSPRIASAFNLTTQDGKLVTGSCSAIDTAAYLFVQSCINTMDINATDLHITGEFVNPDTKAADPEFHKVLNFAPILVPPGQTFEPPLNGSILYTSLQLENAQSKGLAIQLSGYWTTCGRPRSESASSSAATTSPGDFCQVPEPETSMLMVGGLTGLAFVRTRRQKSGRKSDLNKMC